MKTIETEPFVNRVNNAFLFQAPAHFSQDLGELTEQQHARVAAVLLYFMGNMKQHLSRGRILHRCAGVKTKPVCSSCLFNVMAEVWPEYVETAYKLLRSCMIGTAFYCHQNQSRISEQLIDASALIACSGYTQVIAHSEKRIQQLAENTFFEIMRIVPDSPISRALLV